MKIILLDKIEKLGEIGSEVIVKSGYARNFLFPKSKAILATKKNLAIFKEKQHSIQSKIIEKQKQARVHAKIISDIKNITITAQSSIKGKLFGSIGPKDVAQAITKVVDFKILKSQVRLPSNENLKSAGTYNIKIHIYDNIFATLNIIVNVLSKNNNN